MKKRIILLLCLLWFGFNSCTEEIISETNIPNDLIKLSSRITPSEAIKIADSYLDLFFPQTRSTSGKSTPTLEVYGLNSITRSSDRAELDTILYILNYPEKGFVLVGADRMAENLIYGISDTGTFHLQDTIDFPELKTLIKTIENAVIEDVELSTRSSIINSHDNRVWRIQQRIEKPVEFKWGQGSPFNQYCFTTNGQQALAGCGPVAVSQIMAYHKYPTHHENTRTGAIYTYPWDQMKYITDISSAYSQPAIAQQVARFIEQVGSECYANYGVSATSTYLYNCITALEEMGYMVAPVNGNKSIYYDINQVKESLSTIGPVLMTGQSDQGGHAWVIEGYLRMYDITPNVTSTGMKELLKCNWGWNSRADGYYISGIFDTRQGGYVEGNGTSGNYDFYYGLQMVPKIYPNIPESEPTLPKELNLRENECHTLEVNWDVLNKNDYEYIWNIPEQFEYTVNKGQVNFKCNLPDNYYIGLRIIGKNNTYDSGDLSTEIVIEEDEQLSRDYGRMEVIANNNSIHKIRVYMHYGYSNKEIFILPQSTAMFGFYGELNGNNELSINVEIYDSPFRYYIRDINLPKFSNNYRDWLSFDVGNYGFEKVIFTSEDYSDYSFWWEKGMPE